MVHVLFLQFQRIDEGGQLAKACREELSDEVYLERLVRVICCWYFRNPPNLLTRKGQVPQSSKNYLGVTNYSKVRNERVTRGMSDAKYEEFCKARWEAQLKLVWLLKKYKTKMAASKHK